MESTGVYWKPVYHVLSGMVDVYIGNPFDMRRRPGKKTDKADATWIAELLAHGLIQPSFVPPPEISALRDLTRSRVVLVQTRTRAKNRVQGILQDTNLKMSSVMSDVFGKSGRRMLDALIAGEQRPEEIGRTGVAEFKTQASRAGAGFDRSVHRSSRLFDPRRLELSSIWSRSNSKSSMRVLAS